MAVGYPNALKVPNDSEPLDVTTIRTTQKDDERDDGALLKLPDRFYRLLYSLPSLILQTKKEERKKKSAELLDDGCDGCVRGVS